MTQQHPGASRPRVTDATDTPTAPSDGPERVIPHQQSRPGPEDDVMLATGEPVETGSVRTRNAGASAGGSSAGSRAGTSRAGGPGRRAWVPNQHGAWMMLVAPPLIGWIVGGVSWKNLLLLPAWWGAYFAYWAWCQWLRTRSPRKRALLLWPLGVYTAWAVILGMLALSVAPYLLQFSVLLVPLFAVALWQVWSGHERSILSGVATTAAASLMAAVTYCLAVDGVGGFLGVGTAGHALPGSSPNGALTGWDWMWVVTAFTAAYFCGSVPHIRTMIRGRFNRVLLGCSVAFHAAVAGVALWMAVGGLLPWTAAVVWMVLVVRSLVVPLWQWRALRGGEGALRPAMMGLMELVFCLAWMLAIA